ncbi:MAG: tetratricopeptide repeat protein [Thermodesulfovibrionales bacterium]
MYSFLGRGAAHLRLKNENLAIEDFSEAIKANIKSARAYFFRGVAYLLGNNHEKAIEDFSKALELKSNYGMAKFSLSSAYIQLGKFEEAPKDLNEVLLQMEVNLQSFADTYGIVRTQLWRVLTQLSGETAWSALKLSEKEIDTLKKWFSEEE